MTLDDKMVAGMKEKAAEIGKYYFKGLGGLVSIIPSALENYLEGRVNKEQSVETVYNTFKIVEALYSAIPFETLQGKEEFCPLFTVRDLLEKFRKETEGILKDGKNDLTNVMITAQEIVGTGKLYESTLYEILHKIRSTPGSEDFVIMKTDYNGAVWELPLY